MALDGIGVNCLAHELSSSLLNGRIDKIYQPEADTILLAIRAGGKTQKLLLSCNCSYPRLHITNTAQENPELAPNFCMLLRKHIQGGKLVAFGNKDFERLVKIDIECIGSLGDMTVKSLIIEIMGKHSNIILVEDGKIIAACKHVDFTVSSVRQVFIGNVYSPPPKQDKLPLTDIDKTALIRDMKSSTKTVEGFIAATFIGVSKLVANEMCYSFFDELGVGLASVGDMQLYRFADYVADYFAKLSNDEFNPVVVFNGDEPHAFSAVNITHFAGHMRVVQYATLSEALDDFYRVLSFRLRMKQKGQDLLRFTANNIIRCNKKLEINLQKLDEASRKDEKRIFGDILMANLYQLNDVHTKSVRLLNFYTDEEVEIPFNTDYNAAKNAANYYKAYQKLKTQEDIANKQLEAAKEEIAYFETVQQSIENAVSDSDLNEIRQELEGGGYHLSKAPKQPKRKKSNKQAVIKPTSVDVDGFTIYIGRNNLQNDYITHRAADKRDIWFHVKNIPSAHVVMRTQDKEPSPETIVKVAQLCLANSKAKDGQNVPVDYTYIKNVKKPSGAKPGFCIYDNYKTVFVSN